MAGLRWCIASLFPTLPERLSRALLDVPPRRYAEGAPSVAASREFRPQSKKAARRRPLLVVHAGDRELAGDEARRIAANIAKAAIAPICEGAHISQRHIGR